MEKSERYVCIGIEEDSDWVQVISFIKSWTNFLDKRCKQHPDSYKKVSDQIFEDGVCEGREYIVKKKLLPPTIFKAPSKKIMTDEQKQAAGERLQKARKPREKKPIT
jgi:hypothetical protein